MSEQEFDKRVWTFATALNDMYTDVDERESQTLHPIPWKDETAEDDFTAMILAIGMLYMDKCDSNEGIIGFMHIANRLAIKWLTKNQARESEDNSRE